MPLITLSQIKEECRERANMENSGFIGDLELTRYVNKSIRELYDLLVSKYGDDYYLAEEPFNIDVKGAENKYDLPDDFYKAVGVDLAISTGNSIALKPFMFEERNKYTNGHVSSLGQGGVAGARYRIFGTPSKIWFTPSPIGGFNVNVWYIPIPPELEDADDEFDGFNGWEEFVICDVAIKMLQKEESDVSIVAAQKAAIERRIDIMAGNRDAGNPQRVVDVSQNSYESEDGVY